MLARLSNARRLKHLAVRHEFALKVGVETDRRIKEQGASPAIRAPSSIIRVPVSTRAKRWGRSTVQSP
jgi:hypothetical protein